MSPAKKPRLIALDRDHRVGVEGVRVETTGTTMMARMTVIILEDGLFSSWQCPLLLSMG